MSDNGQYTHTDLVESLGAHFRSWPENIVWSERAIHIRDAKYPTQAWKLGIPDVVVIKRSYAAPLPSLYEVKATRSDFMSDITSDKWRKYLEIATRFYFCTPSGMVTKKDIPDLAGWMTFNGERWATPKGARRVEGQLDEAAYQSLLFSLPTERRLVRDAADRLANMQKADLRDLHRHVGDKISKVLWDAEHKQDELESAKKRYDEMVNELLHVLGLGGRDYGLWSQESLLRDVRARMGSSARTPADKAALDLIFKAAKALFQGTTEEWLEERRAGVSAAAHIEEAPV